MTGALTHGQNSQVFSQNGAETRKMWLLILGLAILTWRSPKISSKAFNLVHIKSAVFWGIEDAQTSNDETITQ